MVNGGGTQLSSGRRDVSGGGGGGGGGGRVGSRCRWILRGCLAVHLSRCDPRRPPPPPPDPPPPVHNATEHYWMYDSGYLIFQGFLEANLKCFWNVSLMEAVRQLEFQGYVAPGVLLITANPCALEVVRSAWARNVLKPPPSYSLTLVGDVDDCLVQPIAQGQFTPLPEALCWVILELTAKGHSAVIESIKSTLSDVFPDIQRPSHHVIYDTLAQLSAERKVYQTSAGYFVMTPENRRLRSRSRADRDQDEGGCGGGGGGRQVLMSTEEAVAYVHGEMETLRDGSLTHQAIQTNLADVICGGNPADKILYGRLPSRRGGGGGLERRHSLRLFGSNKRLTALQRSGSMRLLSAHRHHDTASVSDSTVVIPPKKHMSLLSRIFRRSKRRLVGSGGSRSPLSTFSAQFPPTEWFNSRVVHLHSVGTQTQVSRASPSLRGKEEWCSEEHSATLPRRHRRQSSSSGLGTPMSHPPSRRTSPSPISKTLTPSTSSSKSVSPSRSSLSSSKTVVNSRCLSSPTAKSLSSSSSGYNSLPRSKSPGRSATPRGSPLHSATPKLSPNKSSITLQVSTNQNPNSPGLGSIISSVKSSLGDASSLDDKSSTTMTTTINSSNKTKIFVQQQNSPVRSVITFENGVNKSSGMGREDIIVLNPSKPDVKHSNDTDLDPKRLRHKIDRPTSLYHPKENEDKNEKIMGQLETQLKMKFPSSETIQLEEKLLASTKNNKNNQRQQMSSDRSKNATLKAGSLVDMSNVNFGNDSELNNVRKCSISSIPLQPSSCKENLSFNNLLKSSEHPQIPLIFNKGEKNLCSNPPSPTKSLGNINDSFSNYIIHDTDKVNGPEVNGKIAPDSSDLPSFPSLSDLSLHFTSIAAQNILKGVSINSIDTLVEVNMAAEKQNNCDVTIHTDFGCV